MEELETWGWTETGAQSYLHHCGARVTKRGTLWSARTVASASAGRHVTALQAAAYLQENDPWFWSYGKSASFGNCGGIFFAAGCLDGRGKDNVFACHLSLHESFPKYLESTFGKFFFGKATCVRCSLPMADLRTRALREFRFSGGRKSAYIVCACGYPVWRLEPEAFSAAHSALVSALHSWRRKERLRGAGGKHSPEDIQEILAAQGRRCIYCNVRFTRRVPAEKDHLLAVRHGGANWAFNLIMACKRCNSRRCDIPFRTYCRLLSPAQNKRILAHLCKRLAALDFDHLSIGALASLELGLSAHDPRHWRYCDIQRKYPAARRNAAQNQLLPRNIVEKSLKARIKEQREKSGD